MVFEDALCFAFTSFCSLRIKGQLILRKDSFPFLFLLWLRQLSPHTAGAEGQPWEQPAPGCTVGV